MDLNIIIPAISAVLSGAVSWFVNFSRRKTEINKLKAEYEGNELDNVQKAVTIWRDLAEDLRESVTDLSMKCQHLQTEIDQLITENKALKEQISSLKGTIKKMNN